MPGFYVFYLWVILLCHLLVTLFHLISLQSMRFIAFSVGTTFLLPPVSVLAVLILSRALLLVWMEMYLFVSIDFILWTLIFALNFPDMALASLYTNVPYWLNLFLCLSLFPLIKSFFFCGHSLFRLTIITSTFLQVFFVFCN